ncbi:hypothetical protein [Roseibium sp.]|uniref:hypothetical protein n=1 Tax=Roseibium sp. TaxID=1936156 RepID=UPI003A96FEB4
MHPGTSGILVVVFSQVRIPVGKFGLERLFGRTRHSCLFLNDAQGTWYVGLDAEIDQAIDEAIRLFAPDRIVFYGSSMGGYAALRTGLRRKDGTVHAYGTELRLGQPGSRSLEAGVTPQTSLEVSGRFAGAGIDLPVPDKGSAPTLPFHLYWGCLDPVDAGNAALAQKHLPFAQIHLLSSSHSSHDHLFSLNLIRRIIMTFERDPAHELTSKGILRQDGRADLAGFGALFVAFTNSEPLTAEAVTSLAGFDENPGMQRLAAEVLARDGQLEEAVAMLERAEAQVTADPVLVTVPKRWRKQLPFRRATWLAASGRTAEARELLLASSEIFAIDPSMNALAEELGCSLNRS